MKENSPVKRIRCAPYTRKSTDEGLESEFSSIDAQREACEAYITSQKSKGWILVPEYYDDGGFTGANTERPALKRLLQDIKDNKIDIVVVYKHDRLTRSLADFASMIELFEKHNVSFVSVTQEFDTTTSGGRLFLNMLFSFAQYEREIIAERTRDKIAASKKKGMWMGGAVPLGYDAKNKKLVINEQEAEIIRFIFNEFANTKSVTQVVKEAQNRGYSTKTYTSMKNGKTKIGKPIDKGTVYALLRNPLYMGKIIYKGNTYQGQHEAIVSEKVYNTTDSIINENEQRRPLYKTSKPSTYKKTPSLFKGMLSCGGCKSGMFPTYSCKQGKQYRYYVPNSHAKKQCNSCDVGYVSAGEIELVIFNELKRLLRSPEIISQTYKEVNNLSAGFTQNDVTESFKNISILWDELFPAEQLRIIQLLISNIVVQPYDILITFKVSGMMSFASELKSLPAQKDDPSRTHIEEIKGRKVINNEDGTITVVVPAMFRRRGCRKYIVEPENAKANTIPESRLVTALAKAYKWKCDLESGKVSSLNEISAKERISTAHVTRIMNLNFLAPDIVEGILSENLPQVIKFTDVTKSIPEDWSEQRKMLGIF